MEIDLIKNYRSHDKLRLSFNELSKKTFGLEFEDWYQNGYWGDNYIPYSIVIDGNVVANVSVNITDFNWNGSIKHFIQLGTVMTEEQYRNQGLIRKIMNEIEKDYKHVVDGIYLFANDSVLDFYPKYGFQKAVEFQYSKKVSILKERSIVQIPMQEKNAWTKLDKAIKQSVPNSSFEMIDNSGLLMFYVTKFMQQNVYYEKNLDVYVIAEIEDETLLIHHIFSKSGANLDKVIEAFGKDIKQINLGFTPDNVEGYELSEVIEEDTTLFLQGKGFDGFEQSRLMFPALAHA